MTREIDTASTLSALILVRVIFRGSHEFLLLPRYITDFPSREISGKFSEKWKIVDKK